MRGYNRVVVCLVVRNGGCQREQSNKGIKKSSSTTVYRFEDKQQRKHLKILKIGTPTDTSGLKFKCPCACSGGVMFRVSFDFPTTTSST